MLEGLAAWILNTYVGEYLENLNTDQLSIGLLQGEVELENLPLKRDALRELELPVEIRAGFVGKIKLQIPVRHLRSEPWVIYIEKLFLIAGPVLSSEYDEEQEEKSALSRKLARLEALEAKWKGINKTKQEGFYYTNWMVYGTSLMANVIENVQLKIKDVHIRYEDEQSCPSQTFACGIVIQSLTAQSSDQSWAPKFVRRDNSDTMWKLVQLDGLSLYWDPNAVILGRLDPKEMTAAMGKHLQTCTSPSGRARNHDYILSPVNAEAHLTRNCSPKPLRSRFTPRIICDIHLQKIPLSLSEIQYRQIMQWLKEFEVLDVKWKHRKWRPMVPVKNNPKKWWQYAISVHLEPLKARNKTQTWSFIIEQSHDIVNYINIYHKYLNDELLPLEEQTLKEELEKKLSFTQLCILQELVMAKIQRKNSLQDEDGQESKGKGFLQWMFPSWGGWYSGSTELEDIIITEEDIQNKPEIDEVKSHLEEEILDVLDSADNDSLLKRDTVFAQMNFSLSQGTFILFGSDGQLSPSYEDKAFKVGKPIVELEFSDVSTKVETRPRTGSFLFEIKLGALYLYDRIFSETNFPHIVAPQNRDVSFLYTKSSGITVFPLPSFLNQKPEESEKDSHLFELLYEKKPFGIHADHRLNITTRSLDVVYNPQVLRCITDFFCLQSGKAMADFSVGELKLTAAARAKYEVLKQQTKAELQQKWDEILDSEDRTIHSSRWNIEFAISAPQIIIPEDIFDKNSSVVVFDLGKLHFFNAVNEDTDKSISASEDIDDDDDFITPCSTPQELLGQIESPDKTSVTSPSSPPLLLKEHIYEKYTLELNNIQVLVSRLKDNWKFAQLRGTSTMHILDRFSITVQTERRMVYTQDPEWPCIAVTGNLPKLIVHISEQKVNALQTCFDVLNTPIVAMTSVVSTSHLSSTEDSMEFLQNFNEKSTKEKKNIVAKQITEEQADLNEGALLLLTEFCVDQMSFDVQSRGHSVAELQVTGVRTTFSKRPHDISITLCVHSLLLVDAMQTYGPDFELLLASHKHLSMDSTSGSLRDSEPNSPASPGSPGSVSSPQLKTMSQTTVPDLSAALMTLQSSNKKVDQQKKWSSSLHVPKTEHYASDALIIIEINLVESTSDCSEVLQIANVQFNSLDVIANQETIVELVGFVKRIALRRNKKISNVVIARTEESKLVQEKEIASNKHITRTEITFDFHRLNILLLRALSQKQSTVGQKVATATVSGARIQATIGKVIEIHGTLGGLQVLDLITENTRHQKIISIGYDPLTEQNTDLLNRIQDEMYKSIAHTITSEPQNALTFTIIRGEKSETTPDYMFTERNIDNQQGYLDVNLRMASLCYTHSPRLLYELSSCATEFKDYMSTLVSSIKSAATEVAMGIVSKRTESISATIHGNAPDMSVSRTRLESLDDLSEVCFTPLECPEVDVSVELRLDVLLQTPVVAIPSSPESPNVLVAHLGRIAVQNNASGSFNPQHFSINLEDFNQADVILVEVRDMNMHFVNVDNITQTSSTVVNTADGGSVPAMSLKDLYTCQDKNEFIIHETVIEVVVETRQKTEITSDSMSCFIVDEDEGVHYEQKKPGVKNIEVKGRVVTPLKVVLSKKQFQQMLKVLDNLTYIEETPFEFRPPSALQSPVSMMKFPPTFHSSNALKSSRKQSTSITVSFELPDMTAELHGDLNNKVEGIVSLTFREFVLLYKVEQAYEASLQVTLQTLLMEDLINVTEGKRCYLMSSIDHNKSHYVHYKTPPKSDYISLSCPSLTETWPDFYRSSSLSLPDKLHTQNMFSLQHSTQKLSKLKSKGDSYPSTPPPSPSNSKISTQPSRDALVFINVTFIDRKSPSFSTKYRKTNRIIDIDFNCLDITLNLQTWVMVLDFFSLGGDEDDKMKSKETHITHSMSSSFDIKKDEQELESEVTNSEVGLKVKSLTVVLNKPEYKLASANISNFVSDISLREHTYTVKGTLGSISVNDLSPHGYLYPEKFVTTGSEALHFNFFRYSSQIPSWKIDYDMSLKCQMSSVQYVHTHRFLSETTAFFQRFNELQGLIRNIRLKASGADVSTEVVRGSRISLNIAAGSPVIVIPQNSSSADVLVADLGRITVRNTFLPVNAQGTISYTRKFSPDSHSADNPEFDFKTEMPPPRKKRPESLTTLKDQDKKSDDYVCCLDVINVELTDMDLYSAIHMSSKKEDKMKEPEKYQDSDLLFPSFLVRKQGHDLLQQKFMLRVQIDRNLDSAISHQVPDWAIEGVVSSVYVTLDKKQYKLIFGILNQNLGEPIEEFIFDPCSEVDPFILVDAEQGLEKAWTSMAIHIDLVNVTLELIRNEGVVNNTSECSLAKFDFIKSRLSYESFSDNSKDIDLVSNMVQVSDIRFKNAPVNNRPNVFTKILQPTNMKEKSGSTLQAEVHYRITRDCTKFTVLLNNMRILGVFEFLKDVLDFLTVSDSSSSSEPVTPPQKAQSSKIAQKSHSNFELKVNVTDTELVVVEDTALWDSNAVIVKSTAVITWKPNYLEKPLSCSLQSLEVFSCIVGVEDDTALSIIDPLTLTIEIVGKKASPISRLESVQKYHVLEISTVCLNLRLSYYDFRMFMKIFESIKEQTGFYAVKPNVTSPVESSFSLKRIEPLVALGFSRDDCQKALTACLGDLNNAALWLTQNATPKMDVLLSSVESSEKSASESGINLSSAEIRITSCCLCIIDDCRDADVPVIELTLTDLTFIQRFIGLSEGFGNFGFSADYYNRALSGWEPVMEPWKCTVKWKMQPIQSKPSKRLFCEISTSEIINLNVTSSLIDLYKTVKKSWTEDYLNLNSRTKEVSSSELLSPGCYRRRSPFMPFALKNDTGSKLWFATRITSANALDLEDHTMPAQNSKFALSWTEVPAGNLVPVPFGNRVKIRHKDSHETKLHQLIVRVEGWMPLVPVSVDRVGTYFRNARPQTTHLTSAYAERPSARVVFVVSLEGSARKLVTVQSSLSVSNKLEDTMEVKLENACMQYGVKSSTLLLVPNHTLSIPLSFVHAQMWARPIDKLVTFCNHPIAWHHVTKPGEQGGSSRLCNSIQKTLSCYRFAVSIKRQKFPIEKESETSSSSASLPIALQPSHKLTFIPCLEIVNLLPYEINYVVKDIAGYIKAGKGKAIHNVDVSKQFPVKVFLESFKRCSEIAISSSSRHFPTRIELCDNQDRMLRLQLKVISMPGGALKLLVTAPYWFVNKTGLPLVYKQEGTHNEAAGQLEEHELARCMAPLLFSFSDRDASTMCNMRVGRSLHPDGLPQWCTRFHLEKGVRVRRLHVVRKDSRPDLVYNIGIDVRVGRGRYGETNIVTLSPRYQIDNQSSHKLEFCQLFATKENRQFVLSAMPKCSLPFHWPRIDLDNMLCVRQPDIEDCHWSGGFAIDNIVSFHINMRDEQGKSHFLRVEVVLHGATFFVVFTNADRLPPPFRIDNHSEVSITYYQTNVEQERLKTCIRPHSSIPYAFDEPTLPPYITCCAPGGSAATYNMNVFREGNQLFYENFIYIVFTGSFVGEDGKCVLGTAKEYVLDVPYGTKVVINRKETGKRSQLWRMTSMGMLQHEGTSPPRDPHKPNSSSVSRTLVLDIAGLSPQPGEFIPLMLRKPDSRRQHTQTWKFTEDGRLCCAFPNMYVQAQNGFKGLRRGSDVVLGPSLPVNFVTMANGIPVEQAISRQKLRGGSGVLTVKVIPDGPTRVLQISDIKQKQIVSRTSPASDWIVIEEEHLSKPLSPTQSPRSSFDEDTQQTSQTKEEIELQVKLELSGGLGISLVNHLSEELVYLMFHQIMVEYCKTSSNHSLDGSIRDIQVDNQLREAERPVTLYVTQSNKTDDQRHLPSLQFTVIKMESPLLNADIFKHLIVTVKNLTIQLEERLLLKLLQFSGFHQADSDIEKTDESDNQNQNRLTETSAYEKRYYFSTLKLCLQQIKLSMLTTSNLQPDLVQVKKKMRLRLIRFEDALIELSSFLRVHPFETSQFIIDNIIEHYKEELKSQAAKILGAVDFLGNPLGLMNDVTDGISKLIHDGNVGGLIKNVTHGLSDSAAKISETLSDGLGIVAMDDKHQKIRKRIRQDSAYSGNDHFVTGLKGLGFGLIGGMTSIFTQTYEGAAQEGVQGFFSGLGKGLVGTVAKPAVGFLDFASGAASAMRDTSKGSPHSMLSRSRPPRTCVGPGGLLPRYSLQQAIGQDFLYNLNNRDYSELFIAKEQIRSGSEDLHALISSEQVYFLSSGVPSASNTVLTVPFTELYQCNYICSEAGVIGEVRHYLQLTMKADSSMGVPVYNEQFSRKHSRSASNEPLCKKPQVRCDSEEVAQKVTMQINYAKSLHEERTYMVVSDDDSDEEKY